MKLYKNIEDGEAEYNSKNFTMVDVCAPGSACDNPTKNDACACQFRSILGQWNFNITTLLNDDEPLTTLNQYWSLKITL